MHRARQGSSHDTGFSPRRDGREETDDDEGVPLGGRGHLFSNGGLVGRAMGQQDREDGHGDCSKERR